MKHFLSAKNPPRLSAAIILFSILPEPDFRFSAPALAEDALVQNPKLRELKAAINSARAETGLAEKEFFPDFNVRLSYGQREHVFKAGHVRRCPDQHRQG